LFCHERRGNVFGDALAREWIATLRADSAVPAALLVASTVVVVVASVLPGTVGVAAGLGAVAALAVPCFLHLRDRHELWRPAATTWWGEGVVMVPSLALFGLYVVEVRAPAAGVDVPGAIGPPVVAFALGVWTLSRVTRWYVDGVVGDETPLVRWRARRSRRQMARHLVGIGAASAVGGLVPTLTEAGTPLLADAWPSVFGSLVGVALTLTYRARRRRSYAAFAAGIRIEDNRFRHRERITDWELTDRELVIRTDRLLGDVRLRRADLGDVSRIRAMLAYYDGTRPYPPEGRERAPAGVEGSSRRSEASADVDHHW
jgi:hypothetical protein